MLFTPLNNQYVIATFANQIIDVVDIATSVFNEAFFAGSLWAIHTDIEDVIAYLIEKFNYYNLSS